MRSVTCTAGRFLPAFVLGILTVLLGTTSGAREVQAACNYQDKSITLSSSSYSYPFEGGGTGVTVTYAVSYNYKYSGSGGNCGTSQTVTITPAISPNEGSFSNGNPTAAGGAKCIITQSTTASSTSLNSYSGSCTIKWTEPSTPAASYSLTATGNNGVDGATSNSLSFTRLAQVKKTFEVYATPTNGTYTDGDTSVPFTYKIKNTGDIATPTSGTVTVKDNLFNGATATVTCSVASGLAAGSESTCQTKDYTLTANDFDAGDTVQTSLTSTGSSVTGLANWSVGIKANGDGKYTFSPKTKTLEVFAEPTAGTYTDGDTSVQFTYKIKNTGEIAAPAGGVVKVKDSFFSPPYTVTCTLASNLAVNGVATCETKTYTLTANDFDDGDVLQTDLGKAGGQDMTGLSGWSFTITGDGKYSYEPKAKTLEVFATPNDGTYTATSTTVTFTYKITNTGEIDAPAGTIDLKDSLFNGTDGNYQCQLAAPLAPGATATCTTKDYTLKDTDLDDFQTVETDIGEPKKTDISASLSKWTVTVSGQGMYEATGGFGRALTVDVTVAPGIYDEGQVLTFTYLITNVGAVTTDSDATLDDQTQGMTFGTPCNIGSLAAGEKVTCTATYDTGSDNANILAVESDAKASVKGQWNAKGNIQYNNATALSRLLAEGWTFDLRADPPIYEDGKQITFTGIVTNVSFPNPKLKIHDILLVLNSGSAIEPDSCTIDKNNIMLDTGESMTCTWVHDVNQEDLDAGKIIAVGSVKADWKKYKDLTLSDTETLLSEGSAGNMVQNTVGSFIKRRMDQMLANEPTGYKIRNRNGGVAPGMPVAVTGTTVDGGSEVAFATSSRAMAAAAAAQPAKADKSGNGSSVMPTADAITVRENDYNWASTRPMTMTAATSTGAAISASSMPASTGSSARTPSPA